MCKEIEVVEVDEFGKDVKKLGKRFRHIKEDISRSVEAIKTEPSNFHHSVRISGLGSGADTPVFKLKHFRSTDLKGKGCRSGIRLIYAWEDELRKLSLIEVYYHDDESTDCNKARILKYFIKDC